MSGMEYLYRKYFSIVAKTAFYLTKDREVAEDLSQDIFLKIWNNKSKANTIHNIKAYLISSVKNLALNHIKDVSRYTSSDELEFKYIADPAISTHTEEDRLTTLITQYISDLPPKCRLIFTLNRLEGLTNDEIADYLGITKRTVETQISNALKTLRSRLKDITDKLLILIAAEGLFF